MQFIFVGDHLRAKGWETAVRFYGAMGLPASAPASSWRGFSGSLRPSLNPYCSARRSLPHPISAYLLSFASQAGNVGRESEGPRTRLWRGEVWTGASTVGLSPGAGGGQDATYWCLLFLLGWSCLYAPVPQSNTCISAFGNNNPIRRLRGKQPAFQTGAAWSLSSGRAALQAADSRLCLGRLRKGVLSLWTFGAGLSCVVCWLFVCLFVWYAVEIVGKAHGKSLSSPHPCVFHCAECQDGFIGITGLDRHSLMTVIGNYARQWHSPGNFPLQALLSPQSTEGNACKRIIF